MTSPPTLAEIPPPPAVARRPYRSPDAPPADRRRDSPAPGPAGLGPAPAHRAHRTHFPVHSGPTRRVHEPAIPDERPRRRRGRPLHDGSGERPGHPSGVGPDDGTARHLPGGPAARRSDLRRGARRPGRPGGGGGGGRRDRHPPPKRAARPP